MWFCKPYHDIPCARRLTSCQTRVLSISAYAYPYTRPIDCRMRQDSVRMTVVNTNPMQTIVSMFYD